MPMKDENVKFLAVARVHDKKILCLHVVKPLNKKDTAYVDILTKILNAPTWSKQVAPNSRHALDFETNKIHFTMDKGEFVYAAITKEDYPIRLACRMLTELQKEFMAKFEKIAKAAKNTDTQLLGKDGVKMLSSIAAKYDDIKKLDRLTEVKQQVEEVKGTMKDSISIALSNAEKLDVMEQKSNDLCEQAKAFQKNSKDLHKQMVRRNIKIALTVALLLILIILIVLAALGVFNKSSASKRFLRIH